MEWCLDTCDAHAVRTARRQFAERVQREYNGTVDAAGAELVLGELLGNVARHAPGTARVRADFDPTGVTLTVTDHGDGFAAPAVEQTVSLLSESGRGLAIAAQLAHVIEIDCTSDAGCRVLARFEGRRG